MQAPANVSGVYDVCMIHECMEFANYQRAATPAAEVSDRMCVWCMRVISWCVLASKEQESERGKN